MLNVSYQKTRTSGLGAGFFGQRYFFIGSRFFVMGELGINASYNWDKIDNSDNTYRKGSGYSAGVYLTPGFGVKLSKKFLLDLSLNSLAALTYQHSNVKYYTAGAEVDKSTINSFWLSSNINGNTLGNLGLGFRWLM